MRDRPSARLIILDPQDRILLFHFDFPSGPLAGDPFWVTPGGGLDAGESYEQAAQRELLEETGLTVPIGPEIARREARFLSPTGEPIRGIERYYGLRIVDATLDSSGHTVLEQNAMRRHHWWSSAELAETSDAYIQRKLPNSHCVFRSEIGRLFRCPSGSNLTLRTTSNPC